MLPLDLQTVLWPLRAAENPSQPCHMHGCSSATAPAGCSVVWEEAWKFIQC